MSETQTKADPAKSPRGNWLPDFLASTVVFLVALPLCIGIAVACGVSPERGLVTGIIGGIVVGAFSGAPLLVSGPAASLIVLVVELIDTHGMAALAPVVVLAGVWQAIAGTLRLGQWFRAVVPAVITGMLIGIGALILASQLHVCLDAEPRATFLSNILELPQSLVRGPDGRSSLAPLAISTAMIGIIVAWDRWRPRSLTLVPGQLVALFAVTSVTLLLGAKVAFLEISPRFFDGLAPASLVDFSVLAKPEVFGLSFIFAFVASAATLLTATAIDQRQTRSKSNYDRELFAQGIGNTLTGIVGGLPMTGVIVRSSVNVDAGARTRRSTILHGIWILLFVSAAPQILGLLPRASLGAILVYTGYRLIDRRALAGLYQQGRAELGIALITLFGVVFIDLFMGIMAGLAAAIAKIVYTFARLEISSTPNPAKMVQDLHLTGSATFLQLPRLANILETVPEDRELHVHIDRLDHIDHACLELLSSWSTRRQSAEQPGMVVEWDDLTKRYRNAMVGGAREEAPPQSVMHTIWAEWKHLYGPLNRREGGEGKWQDFIDAPRTRLQIDANSLDEVLTVAAELLAPVAKLPATTLAAALQQRAEGHVALGGGVSVPHAPIAELDNSLAALVTTKRPLEVGGETADVFFVLLAPSKDPRKHLQALAHVGRLCHDDRLLGRLRETSSAAEAAGLLRSLDPAVFDTGSFAPHARLLAAVELEDGERAQQIAGIVDEAFGRSAVGEARTEPFAMVRRVLHLPVTTHLVLLALEERDVVVLHALLEEERLVVGGPRCPVHLLRPDGQGSGVTQLPKPSSAPRSV
ncbi:MAG: PTS sugar transporter subunit IIA [Deltaproteobacteria bacterium]|nr:PTS sugar transporter subunit IIA [Deltaproteobacteria bacterium]